MVEKEAQNEFPHTPTASDIDEEFDLIDSASSSPHL
jgi:hypothetical protein